MFRAPQPFRRLKEILLTKTVDGLPGGRPDFYRLAEMLFDSPDAVRESAESVEWQAMREDAAWMVQEFGVDLDAAAGWEVEGQRSDEGAGS
jgi:hypothetical protein